MTAHTTQFALLTAAAVALAGCATPQAVVAIDDSVKPVAIDTTVLENDTDASTVTTGPAAAVATALGVPTGPVDYVPLINQLSLFGSHLPPLVPAEVPAWAAATSSPFQGGTERMEMGFIFGFALPFDHASNPTGFDMSVGLRPVTTDLETIGETEGIAEVDLGAAGVWLTYDSGCPDLDVGPETISPDNAMAFRLSSYGGIDFAYLVEMSPSPTCHPDAFGSDNALFDLLASLVVPEQWSPQQMPAPECIEDPDAEIHCS